MRVKPLLPSLGQRTGERTDRLIFLDDQLGMSAAQAAE